MNHIEPAPGPNARQWTIARELENVLAHMISLAQRRQVILAQALNSGDYDVIFAEAHGMARDLEVIRQFFTDHWYNLNYLLRADRGRLEFDCDHCQRETLHRLKRLEGSDGNGRVYTSVEWVCEECGT